MEKEATYCTCKDCPCWEKQGGSVGDIVKQKPEITYNTNRTFPNGKKAPDGIEIRFGVVRPTAEVREMMKQSGYRFSDKQKIWYAKDNKKSRELAKFLEENEVDVDTTQYEKLNFWAKIKSISFYNALSNFTEFMVLSDPPVFYRNKKHLESSNSNPKSLVLSKKLRFKKFFNKVVGEEGEENEERDEEGNEEQTDTTPSKNESSEIAVKLISLAESMQKLIDAKLNSATSRQRPTAKRMRTMQSMREDGYRLQDIQELLFALGKAHQEGTIKNYKYLTKIRSKSHIELLNRYRLAKKHNWGDESIQRTFTENEDTFNQLGIKSVHEWSLAEVQRQELLQKYSSTTRKAESDNERKIKELEMQIIGAKIPGFFPTPKDLAKRLIGLANINSHHQILDPSAGKGDLLDAIKEVTGISNDNLFASEINATLRQILTLKNYTVIENDFLEVEKTFDRIIMNPPFENGNDVTHVLHAFKLLKTGGRVVAIMGEGAFFRQFQKDKSFREFLMEHNAYLSEPIKEAFKNAFNSTGVVVRIVAINEDGSQPDFENENEEDSSDEEAEMLELMALAEIELLKMQVERERRRKKSKGFEGIDLGKLQRLKEKAINRNRDWDVLDFK